jgi:hypothetical protein
MALGFILVSVKVDQYVLKTAYGLNFSRSQVPEIFKTFVSSSIKMLISSHMNKLTKLLGLKIYSHRISIDFQKPVHMVTSRSWKPFLMGLPVF